MSAGQRWIGEPRTTGPTERTLVEPGVVVEHAAAPRPVVVPAVAPRERLDLDKVQETAWAVSGAVIYLAAAVLGLIGFTQAVALWAGALFLFVAGGLPSGYTLRKAAQRRAATAAAEDSRDFRAGQDQPDPPAGVPTFR